MDIHTNIFTNLYVFSHTFSYQSLLLSVPPYLMIELLDVYVCLLRIIVLGLTHWNQLSTYYKLVIVFRCIGSCFREGDGFLNNYSSRTCWYHDQHNFINGGYTPAVSNVLIDHSKVQCCLVCSEQ